MSRQTEIEDAIQDAISLLEHPDMGGTNLGKALRLLRKANRLLRIQAREDELATNPLMGIH